LFFLIIHETPPITPLPMGGVMRIRQISESVKHS
jgi:hypothetical protein